MCGILGVFAKTVSELAPAGVEAIVHRLLTLSESRGKEASGLATVDGDTICVYKHATSASDLLRTRADRG